MGISEHGLLIPYNRCDLSGHNSASITFVDYVLDLQNVHDHTWHFNDEFSTDWPYNIFESQLTGDDVCCNQRNLSQNFSPRNVRKLKYHAKARRGKRTIVRSASCERTYGTSSEVSF